MKIKEILIINLWGHKTVKWNLHESINILSGENGTGKSVILQIIHSLLSFGHFPSADNNSKWYCEEVIILLYGKSEPLKFNFEELKEKVKIHHKNELLTLLRLNKRDLDDIRKVNPLLSNNYDTSDNDEGLKEAGDHLESVFYNMNKSLSKSIESFDDDYKPTLNIDYIDTFDYNINSYRRRLKGNTVTTLDTILDSLSRDLHDYIYRLNKDLLEGAYDFDDIKLFFSKIEDENKLLTLYKSITNDFLASSNKTIDIDKRKMVFEICDKKLDSYSLSSGEKQLIIILTKVLLQNKQEYILLLDEPEVSLNIEWQRKLLENVLKLNPHQQIIMTSHSPGMLLDGWYDYVSNINDLII